jgi:hypothetical protein
MEAADSLGGRRGLRCSPPSRSSDGKSSGGGTQRRHDDALEVVTLGWLSAGGDLGGLGPQLLLPPPPMRRRPSWKGPLCQSVYKTQVI